MRSMIVTLCALASLAALGCDKKADAALEAKPAPAPVESAAGKKVAITASEDGFAPAEVTVKKGEETTLVFTRTTEKTCANEVEFPELKIKKALPLNEAVAITIPGGEARTLAFQCGMGMYKSKVVIQ